MPHNMCDLDNHTFVCGVDIGTPSESYVGDCSYFKAIPGKARCYHLNGGLCQNQDAQRQTLKDQENDRGENAGD